MHAFSIRTPLLYFLLFMVLAPVVFLSISLIIFIEPSQQQDLDNLITERNSTMTRQLSVAIEYAVSNKQDELLQNIANSSLKEDGLRSLHIFDANKRAWLRAGPLSLVKVTPELLSDQPKIVPEGHLSLAVTPVYSAQEIIAWLSIEYDHRSYDLKSQRQHLLKNIFILISIVLGLSLCMYFYFSVRKDINRANDGIKELAKGKTNQPVQASSCLEIFNLAKHFNYAINQLTDEFAKMHHNVELTTNDLKETIETIEVQNIELNIAKKSATSASEVKSEFLANTSHEIRTPLNGIIGFTKLLGKTKLKSQQRDYIEIIEQSCAGLLGIINDVLDFSKIEAEKLELDYQPLNLQDIFDESQALFAPAAHEKGIEIATLIYQDVPLVLEGDALRIKQIITNLLSNAIKFTQAGSIETRVSLESETDDDVQISIEIKDTGIGMSQKHQDALFEAFIQGGQSVTAEYGGTGLGLTITKKLIDLMHGNIHIESHIDQGSTFHFTLTLKKFHHAETADENNLVEQIPSIEDKHVVLFEQHELSALGIKNLSRDYRCSLDIQNDLEDFKNLVKKDTADGYVFAAPATKNITQTISYIEQFTQTTQKPCLILLPMCQATVNISFEQDHVFKAEKPVSRKKIHSYYQSLFNTPQSKPEVEKLIESFEHLEVLITDDQPANIKLLDIFLSDLNISVTQATNGEEALHKAKHKPFDLIFMDLQMPIMDGITASKAIKDDSRNMETPIVALSANLQQHAQDKHSLELFDLYLSKPIDEQEIIKTIKQLCLATPSKNKPLIEPSQTEQLKQPSQIPVIQNLGSNHIIDVANCLSLCNQKADLAIDMYKAVIVELKQHRKELILLFSNNNYTELEALVHRIHGACCYTGLPELKMCCKNFENALINKLDDDELEPLAEDLDIAIEEVIMLDNSLDVCQAIKDAM